MRKIRKILISIAFTIALCVLGALGSCSNLGLGKYDLKQAYKTYSEYMKEIGKTPVSYESWLSGVQGSGKTDESGVGIARSYWTANGELVFVFTDGTELNAGKISPPAHEHAYGEWQDMISTCTQRWQTRTCETCENSQTRSITPIGHTYKQGVCEFCAVYESDEYNGDYGLEYLATIENGMQMQSLYWEINDAVREFHVNATSQTQGNVFASVNYQEKGLTTEQALAVWKTFKDDNPLFYWLSYSVQYTDETLDLLVVEEYTDSAVRMQTTQSIYEKIKEYQELVVNETSEYAIALAFHDAIISTIDYARENNAPSAEHWAHSIVGVFEERGGVCEAYARAYQVLLNKSGVENLFVTGTANGENHAWNMVKLDDDKWYYADITWDDTPTWEWGISYNYFCVSENENVKWKDGGWTMASGVFSGEHTPHTPQNQGVNFLYELPSVSQTEFNQDGVLKVRDLFQVDENSYAVAGYNTVQFVDTECENKQLIVPETVEYQNREYTVISIGGMHPSETGEPSKKFIGNNAVNLAISVHLPKSVRFIWDGAMISPYMHTITIDEQNQWFTVQDNVLFTKNLYTLVQYPRADTRTQYVIPDETVIVAKNSITDGVGFALEKLTLGKKVKTVSQTNWGFGYPDSVEEDKGGNSVAGSMAMIADSMKGNVKIIVPAENPSYYADDKAVYDKDKKVLFGIFKTVTEYEIPASVQRVDSFVIENGRALESLTVETGSLYLTAENGVLYNASKTEIIDVIMNITGEITIANGVTEISSHTFFGREKMTKIILPNTLTQIGSSAFTNCVALTEAYIPNSVTSVGEGVFSHCEKLTIYCETENPGKGWAVNWAYSVGTPTISVVWGYKKS